MGSKTKIEWCDATWNPVTGCLHGCEYCYARKIADRFSPPFAPKLGDPGMEGACKYDSPEGMDTMLELQKPFRNWESRQIVAYPMAFYPTFHRYLLDVPAKWKKPRTIFVCSMADLFGDWVPDEWIAAVFKACAAAPQHRYLFLTKNPKRYRVLYESKALPYAYNFWFGTTLTKPGNEFTWFNDTPYNGFISIEPMLERFGKCQAQNLPEWIIIGAETGRRKGKVVPEKTWIDDIGALCLAEGVPLFMKDSLIPIVEEENMIREYPW